MGATASLITPAATSFFFFLIVSQFENYAIIRIDTSQIELSYKSIQLDLNEFASIQNSI